MGLPGVTDQTVYRGLKDVLLRQPEITTVQYEPDSISKERLCATIAPTRVGPPTGPTAPDLRVEWRFHQRDSYYRIHYSDPNTGFNCGWHRDTDHPNLGPVHFQYEHPRPVPATTRVPSSQSQFRRRSCGPQSRSCSKRGFQH